MPKPSLTRRADGRYRVKYQGKQFYGDTQKEAYAKRDEYRRMLEAGIKAEADGLTVQAYAMRWVKTYKAHLTPAAYDAHVRILNRFIEHKCIGQRAMKDIDTMDIQGFLNAHAGKSVSTLHKIKVTLCSLFRYALSDRVIQHDPTVKLQIPKGTKGTHRDITQHERELISRAVHRLRPAVMAMLYAGLRRGEVMAMNVDRDVDFECKTITVREAVRFEDLRPVITSPKTDAGLRTVPLLDVLAAELRGKHGLLIAKADGTHMTESAWDRAWASYLTALSTLENGHLKRWHGKTKAHIEMKAKYDELISAGDQEAASAYVLPPWHDIVIRPHDLRHSYCTMLYDAGVDIKTAQTWMGHADASVTMDIYTHLTNERQKTASTALESAAKQLFGVQNGVQLSQASEETIV